MKKYIFVSLLLLLSSSLHAQNVVTVNDDDKTEDIDLPEGMLVSDDELMEEYNNKENLQMIVNPSIRDLSYDDSVIVSRLLRIPTTIEMPLNNVTRKFIEEYSNKRKRSVAIMLGSANFYMPIFEEALERYGLPLELKYLPVIESGLRPSATSRVGAAGLWQFMIHTGKRYGLEINTLVDERRDPIKSSDAAARYLRDLYEMFGDWGLAISAYNCGEGNVQKAILRSGNTDSADFWTVYGRLPRETRGYMPAFIAANYIMNYYCNHGINPYEATLPVESDTVVVKSELKFSQISSVCGVSVDLLRSLNPQYRRDIIPVGYALRLPSSSIESYITNELEIVNAVPTDGIVRRPIVEDLVDTSRSAKNSRNKSGRNVSGNAEYYTVKKNDTLGSIAGKFRTKVSALKRLNNMKKDFIREGQKLRVK